MSINIRPHGTNDDKRPRLYTIYARITNIFSSPKKPMSISINNSLRCVNLHIGNSEDNENRIRMLVYTRAVINSGSLEYHLRVMSQCPEMVEEYLQCGKDTAYDLFHLVATLDLKDTNQDDGKMTTAVWNKNLILCKVVDHLFFRLL